MRGAGGLLIPPSPVGCKGKMRGDSVTWLGPTALLLALLLVGTSEIQSASSAIELGELEALPGEAPPFSFRLPILRQPPSPAALPSVVVRRPSDVLFFLKQGVLEIRLLELADVELEIGHAGQTLNRLLLKAELQAARARMQAAMGWDRYQTAKAKGIKDARLERFFDETYRAHQAWAEVDPAGARQQLQRVQQERLRLQEGRASRQEEGRGEALVPRRGTSESVLLETRMAALEQELRSARQEIQGVTGQVTARLERSPTPTAAGPCGEQTAASVLTVALGGLLVAGIASLLTGYSMQRRVVRYGQLQRRPPGSRLPPGADALSRGSPTTPAISPIGPRAIPSEVGSQSLPSVVRRVRISHRTSRRVRINSPHTRMGPADNRIQPPIPVSTPPQSPASDLAATLASLQQELLSLQGSSSAQPIPLEQLQALLRQLTEMAKRI